jgi:hypothetical protein
MPSSKELFLFWHLLLPIDFGLDQSLYIQQKLLSRSRRGEEKVGPWEKELLDVGSK